MHYEVSMQGLQTGAELIKAAGIFVKLFGVHLCTYPAVIAVKASTRT